MYDVMFRSQACFQEMVVAPLPLGAVGGIAAADAGGSIARFLTWGGLVSKTGTDEVVNTSRLATAFDVVMHIDTEKCAPATRKALRLESSLNEALD